MERETNQIKTWNSNFGKKYTDRNLLSIEDMETLYKNKD